LKNTKEETKTNKPQKKQQLWRTTFLEDLYDIGTTWRGAINRVAIVTDEGILSASVILWME